MDYEYDICFIGGGLNYAGAVVASRGGMKTVLIEKDLSHLGGTCLHNGCIPSKMWLHASETLWRSAAAYCKGSLRLDMKKLQEEKKEIVANATQNVTMQCGRVELIEGEGVLTAPHRVEVAGKTLTARYVVIGTGSSPYIPEGVVYDGKRVVTSDEILQLQKLPEKIAIYGDGAIGLEMASFFAAAGVETDLIWRHATLLRKAHPSMGRGMMKQMERIGVGLLPERRIVSAERSKYAVRIVDDKGGEYEAPMLLVATGRRANVGAVRTDAVAIGPRGIETDEHFETTLPDHYAIGDCNGKLQLAHAARAQVLHVVRRILGEDPDPFDPDRVVRFIHTLPAGYASVGKTKISLESERSVYKESLLPLGGLPYAKIHDAPEGKIAVYSDEEGFIVGAEILAPDAEELAAIVAMALAGEMDVSLAKRTVMAHPTFSELLERTYGKL